MTKDISEAKIKDRNFRKGMNAPQLMIAMADDLDKLWEELDKLTDVVKKISDAIDFADVHIVDIMKRLKRLEDDRGKDNG